ncbi:MAG: hypothetical protein AAGU32_14210 [Bacillota bacterium]
MPKTKRGDKFENAADKVQLKSERNGISAENQNQQHNTQKEALGPNTKR